MTIYATANTTRTKRSAATPAAPATPATPARRGRKPKATTPTKPAPVLVTGYESEVSFFATRYTQGKRTVYALDLSVAQIVGLIPAPDPARPLPGNRRIQPQHAAEFGEYIRTHEDWVSPGIVLRGPTAFDFNPIESIAGADFGVVSLPTLAVADLHIVDGQHRILGMHLAAKGIADDLDRARDALARARKAGDDPNLVAHFAGVIKTLNAQRKRFENERVSIQVFVETEQSAYQQIFYDMADNALPITGSVRARFDKRKITNRTLTNTLEHPLLSGRVDLERDRLGRINQNLLSAKHIVDLVRILTVGLEGRVSRRLEDELKDEDLAQRSNEFFDALSQGFHQLAQVEDGSVSPAELRQHSMLGSPVTIRVLAGVYYELRAKGFDHDAIVHFFEQLDPYLSQPATKFLVEHGGKDVFFEGALGPSSRRQDLKEFRNVLVEWAVENPSWLGK